MKNEHNNELKLEHHAQNKMKPEELYILVFMTNLRALHPLPP